MTISSTGLAAEQDLRLGLTSTATSASALNLTFASTTLQQFTGTTAGQVVELPSATTLGVGQRYSIINDSSVDIQIEDGGGNLLAIAFPYDRIVFKCTGTGSTAGSWTWHSTTRDSPSNTPATVRIHEDFLGSTATGGHSLGWATVASGTGAGATFGALKTANNFGVVELSTGTTATGGNALSLNQSSFVFGGGVFTWEAYVYLPALSTSTQTYQVWAGFGNNTSAANFTDGVFFTYIYSAQSGNWGINTAANGTVTASSSGIAPITTGFQSLKFIVNAAGTVVQFYVGGVSAGTITTNIPTTLTYLSGPTFKIEKTVGTTASTFYIDFMTMTFTPTTPRQ